MSNLSQMLATSGVMDTIEVIHSLDDISFDDLRRLIELNIKHPEIGERITNALVQYNAIAFYKEIKEILIEYGVILRVLPQP